MRYWLLDLTIGGQVYRRTDAPERLTVTNAVGATFVYDPGLGSLAIPRPDSWDVQVGVTIEDSTDWNAYGTDIEEAPATLRRWAEGEVMEESQVIASGSARDVEWGEQGEGLALTITVDAADSDLMLSPQARIDAATFPTGEVTDAYVREEAAGTPYILPIGYPGHAPNLGGPYTVVPVVLAEWTETALSLDDSRVYLADGRIEAGTVPLSDGEVANYTVTDLTVETSQDLLGRTFSYCDFQDDNTLNPGTDQKTALYIGFQNDSTYGGGLVDPYAAGSVALRGAGSIIRWVLRRTGSRLRVDWQDLERHLAWFESYKIDTWVNDPEIRGLEWLDAVVLPLIPHRWVTTPRGLSIRPWRWDATAADAIAHLRAPADLERTSSLRVSKGNRQNEVTVRYRPMRAQGIFRSARTLTAQPSKLSHTPGAGTDARILPSLLAAASQKRFGVHPISVDLTQSWDDATALLHTRDLLREHAMPHTAVSYQAHESWERLQVGDVILLTDADLGLAERVALVESVTVGDDQPVVAVILPHRLIVGE